MSSNEFLGQAHNRKRDEFYTQRDDIERELHHYRRYFRDKVVYLNCDDPTVSNFFVYFKLKFHDLGLKRLMATCYRNQSRDMFTQLDDERAVLLEYSGTKNENQVPDPGEIETHLLRGDGDFRSEECVELLGRADIVVTNPPFSLFREYMGQLMEHSKDFLILGPQNAITYKEVFPLLKDEKIWLGVDNGGTKWFEVQQDYEILSKSRKKFVNGRKYFSMGNVNWYTNLDHHARHQRLVLYRDYTATDYPRYDNYPAIEVSAYKDIPADYGGEMGVPISFLARHNPDQFELIGLDRPLVEERTGKQSRFKINGKEKFARLVIRRKERL